LKLEKGRFVENPIFYEMFFLSRGCFFPGRFGLVYLVPGLTKEQRTPVVGGNRPGQQRVFKLRGYPKRQKPIHAMPKIPNQPSGPGRARR